MYDSNLGFWGIGRKVKKTIKKADPKKLGQKLESKGKEILGKALAVLQPPLTQPPAEFASDPAPDSQSGILNNPLTIPALLGAGILLYIISRK